MRTDQDEAVVAVERQEDDASGDTVSTKRSKPKAAKSDKAARKKAKTEAKAERKQAVAFSAKADPKSRKEEKTVTGPSGRNGKARVKFESVMARTEAVAYLEAVVEGLRKGAIKFRQGGNTAALTPADNVEVQVKARRRGDHESVSFELAWRAGEEPTIAITSN